MLGSMRSRLHKAIQSDISHVNAPDEADDEQRAHSLQPSEAGTRYSEPDASLSALQTAPSYDVRPDLLNLGAPRPSVCLFGGDVPRRVEICSAGAVG
jgi:hypothetical protein